MALNNDCLLIIYIYILLIYIHVRNESEEHILNVKKVIYKLYMIVFIINAQKIMYFPLKQTQSLYR